MSQQSSPKIYIYPSSNKCLHGKVECLLNKLQMCAKKYMTADWMITMGCIQGRKTYESGVECIQDEEEGNK